MRKGELVLIRSYNNQEVDFLSGHLRRVTLLFPDIIYKIVQTSSGLCTLAVHDCSRLSEERQQQLAEYLTTHTLVYNPINLVKVKEIQKHNEYKKWVSSPIYNSGDLVYMSDFRNTFPTVYYPAHSYLPSNLFHDAAMLECKVIDLVNYYDGKPTVARVLTMYGDEYIVPITSLHPYNTGQQILRKDKTYMTEHELITIMPEELSSFSSRYKKDGDYFIDTTGGLMLSAKKYKKLFKKIITHK